MIETKELTIEDLPEILLKENDPRFNILKFCEELTELQEKLLKYLTKTPEKRPSKKEIVDEFGDMALRGAVVLEQLEIDDDDIDARVEEKAEKLLAWYKEGKYKGGL
jgi:hypothetical protein